MNKFRMDDENQKSSTRTMASGGDLRTPRIHARFFARQAAAGHSRAGVQHDQRTLRGGITAVTSKLARTGQVCRANAHVPSCSNHRGHPGERHRPGRASDARRVPRCPGEPRTTRVSACARIASAPRPRPAGFASARRRMTTAPSGDQERRTPLPRASPWPAITATRTGAGDPSRRRTGYRRRWPSAARAARSAAAP